jgi:acyl-[acyl-carrier-protein] desaturase
MPTGSSASLFPGPGEPGKQGLPAGTPVIGDELVLRAARGCGPGRAIFLMTHRPWYAIEIPTESEVYRPRTKRGVIGSSVDAGWDRTYGGVSYGTVGYGAGSQTPPISMTRLRADRRMELTVTDLQTALLHELEPVVEENLERHLSVVRPWLPHDYVPWSRGRDFAFLGGEDWVPEDSPLDPVAKAALLVNLLTEDNLPSYHREIATRFGRDGAWGTWVGQWTAEEGRHSIALRDYLVVTRGVDPTTLERLRMEHTIAGYDSGDKTPLAALAYVSFQELATRVSHRNTGRASGCPVADQLLSRVAIDENLHMVFYRNVMAAALEIAPDAAMSAIRDEVVGFAMPGIGMTDFQKNSIIIAKAGIYDLRIHHDDVLQPVLRFWRIFDRSDFGPEGEKARTDLAQFLAAVDERAKYYEEKAEARKRVAELV